MSSNNATGEGEGGGMPLDDKLYSKSYQTTVALIKALNSIPIPSSTSISTNDATNRSTSTDSDTSSSSQSIEQLLTKIIPYQFLALKQTQRALCVHNGLTLQSNIQQKRKDVESQSLLLQNLIYEKSHLEREIKDCEEGFDNVFLYKMAKDELGLNDNEKDATDKPTHSHDVIINSYFKLPSNSTSAAQSSSAAAAVLANTEAATTTTTAADSYRNPNLHQRNMAKLHAQYSQRGKLQAVLSTETKRKVELLSQLKDSNSFLNDIPDQIAKLENWSMPLQAYFRKQQISQQHKHNHQTKKQKLDDSVVGGGGGVELMIGTERRNRLRHAKELSGPLYTLFLQFQSYLDAHCTKKKIDDDGNDGDDNDDDDKSNAQKKDKLMNDIHDWKLHVIDCIQEKQDHDLDCNDDDDNNNGIQSIVYEYTQRENKAVQLWIPIPNITIVSSSTSTSTNTNTGTKSIDYAKIQFEYIPKLQVVTVHIVGDTRKDGEKLKKSVSSLEQLLWCKQKQQSKPNNSKLKKSSSFSSLILLNHLFHNDDGMDLPHGSAIDLCFGRDDVDDDDDDEDKEAACQEKEEDDTTKNDHDNDNDNDETMVEYDDDENEDKDDIHPNSKKQSKNEIILDAIRSKLIQQPNSHKTYNWCQYLAGLHYPTTSTATATATATVTTTPYRIDPTTKSTMMRLSRRIRSHATLSAMIKMMTKSELPNPIPVHPSMEGHFTTENARGMVYTKVEKWVEDTNSSSCIGTNALGEVCKYYNVSFKRKSKALNARVKIDPRYPAVPPAWSLQPSSSVSNTTTIHSLHGNNDNRNGTNVKEDQQPSLYDSALGQLEVEVNTLNGISRFLNEKVEESYDWILMHQLRVIVSGWDGYQQALEKDKSHDGDDGIIAQRFRRGRDRRPISSLDFELFKYGL